MPPPAAPPVPSTPHRVVVTAPPYVPVYEVNGRIEDRLTKYLHRFSDACKSADLRIDVREYDLGSRFLRYMFPLLAGATRVELTMSGTVNNAPIDRHASAACAIGLFFGGDSQELARGCMHRCVDQFIAELDDVSNREPLAYAQFLARWQVLKWIATVTASVLYFAAYYFMVMRHAPFPNPAAGIMLGMLVGLGVYGAMSAVLLTAAPREYLVDEPRGQIVVRRTGVRDPSVFRVVMIVTFAFSLALAALCIWVLLM
jgi:hypothetical protein